MTENFDSIANKAKEYLSIFCVDHNQYQVTVKQHPWHSKYYCVEFIHATNSLSERVGISIILDPQEPNFPVSMNFKGWQEFGGGG